MLRWLLLCITKNKNAGFLGTKSPWLALRISTFTSGLSLNNVNVSSIYIICIYFNWYFWILQHSDPRLPDSLLFVFSNLSPSRISEFSNVQVLYFSIKNFIFKMLDISNFQHFFYPYRSVSTYTRISCSLREYYCILFPISFGVNRLPSSNYYRGDRPGFSLKRTNTTRYEEKAKCSSRSINLDESLNVLIIPRAFELHGTKPRSDPCIIVRHARVNGKGKTIREMTMISVGYRWWTIHLWFYPIIDSFNSL